MVIALVHLVSTANIYATSTQSSNTHIFLTVKSVWETGNGIDMVLTTRTEDERPIKDVYVEVLLAGTNLTRSGISDEDGLINIHFPEILGERIIVNLTKMIYLGWLDMSSDEQVGVILNDTADFKITLNFVSEWVTGEWINGTVLVTSMCKEINFRDLRLVTTLTDYNGSSLTNGIIVDWPCVLNVEEVLCRDMKVLYVSKDIPSGSYRLIMALVCGNRVLSKEAYDVNIKRLLKLDLKVRDKEGRSIPMIKVTVDKILNGTAGIHSIEEKTDSSGVASFMLEPGMYLVKMFMGNSEMYEKTIDLENDIIHIVNLKLTSSKYENKQQMTLNAIISMLSSMIILSIKHWKSSKSKK